MLAPGTGKTHRAYLWAYAAGAFEPVRAVVYGRLGLLINDSARCRSSATSRDSSSSLARPG